MGLIVVSYWGEELFGSHNVPLGSGVKGPLGLGVVVSHWGEGVLGLHWCPIGVKGFWVSGLWCWVSILVSQWDDGVIGSTLRCPIEVEGFWVYIEVSHWGEEVLGLRVVVSHWG